MRASTIFLGVLLLSGPAFAADLTIPNASFEEADGDGAAEWHWWSRTNVGSAVRDPDERHSGAASVRLSHDGPRDWAFPSHGRFPARPGESYLASAWAKVKTGHVELAVVALEKGKTLSWDIGSARAGAADRWVRIEAVADVPERCDEIYVRFVGGAETLAWVDDVALESWERPPSEARPKVEGHARERVRERLDRGVVARPLEGGEVYIGWRLLDDDIPDVAFNVFRRSGDARPVRLNERPVTLTTDFVDRDAPAGEHAYFVRVVRGRGAGRPSREAIVVTGDEAGGEVKPYFSIRLDGDHTFQKVGIADLDGDGRYDFVIKQPKSNIDPYEKYWHRSPGPYKLEAYRHDGREARLLWRRDLGWAIEQGIWYSPYVVHDLDGDGRAEVAVKTGDGDPRDEDGRVTSGPEHLSILDGLTGEPRARVDWPSREGFGEGLTGYNYASRNQIGVAYLDGKTPCVIVERGTYRIIKLVAYEFHDGKLRELWRWSNADRGVRRTYWGQGAHRIHAADVDGDGRDEVLIGSAAIDDNGSELWTTGLGHPDHFYLGDIDPERPGLEIYYGIESRRSRNGLCLVEAATGRIIWGHDGPTRHVHGQGLCSDIDARHPGAECYGADTDEQKKLAWARLYSAKGEVLSEDKRLGFAPRAVWWDADLQREVLNNGRIADYGSDGAHERYKGHVAAVADILGDWREEVMTSVEGEIRIYTTTIPAADRRVCLMQDPLYRADVATAAMGYFQVPMPGRDLRSRASAREGR